MPTLRHRSATLGRHHVVEVVTMFGRGVALGLLALAVASSAGAQGNLDRGKSAAELYTSACATCHKSPQNVSKTKWLFGLESFLRQHYTSSSESAAILAAYLKGREKPSADAQRGGVARHATQTKPSGPTLTDLGEEIPRPPADIPDIRR
jgi:hypothetical protein